MNLYTIVTNDMYELPVICDIRVKEAAEFLDTTPGNVRQIVLRPRKRAQFKVIVTGRVVFDKKDYNKRYSMEHDRSEYFRENYRRKKVERMREDMHVPVGV